MNLQQQQQRVQLVMKENIEDSFSPCKLSSLYHAVTLFVAVLVSCIDNVLYAYEHASVNKPPPPPPPPRPMHPSLCPIGFHRCKPHVTIKIRNCNSCSINH